MVYVKNYSEVGEEQLVKGSAKRTWVRYLIDTRHGASRFYLRMYQIEPGGNTPEDIHDYEHEVYVLSGSARLVTRENGVIKNYMLKEGDFVFINSNEFHQFVNDSNRPFVMLCVRGSELKESGGC